MKFAELQNGDKVVDIIQENGKRLDGQILEYKRDTDGMEYLCSDRSMWPLFQFSEDDYQRYEGEQSVGEYVMDVEQSATQDERVIGLYFTPEQMKILIEALGKASNESFICPSKLGLQEFSDDCNPTRCEDCWRAALKEVER